MLTIRACFASAALDTQVLVPVNTDLGQRSDEEDGNAPCSACCTSRCSRVDSRTPSRQPVLLKMAKVMQHRYVPAETAEQSYVAHEFRTDEVHATQPADQGASLNGSPLTSSDVHRVESGQSVLPTFDLSPMLESEGERSSEQLQQLCQALADCLRNTGCLVVRDPRVDAEDNTAFLDMMERYFAQSTAAKLKDTRPDLHFQVSTVTKLATTHNCNAGL